MQRRSSHRIRGFASIAARRGQDQYRNASLDLSLIVPPAILTSATDNAPRRYYNRRYLKPPQLLTTQVLQLPPLVFLPAVDELPKKHIYVPPAAIGREKIKIK